MRGGGEVHAFGAFLEWLKEQQGRCYPGCVNQFIVCSGTSKAAGAFDGDARKGAPPLR
jgi:hypothetical protein